MKTVLDDAYTWFLDSLYYRESRLVVAVVEGSRATEPRNVELPGIGPTNTYAILPAEHGRRVAIVFQRPIVWQCVDESWTRGDEYEEREGEGALQVLTRSRYLDYVHANHGWFVDVIGPAKHYRVWTQDEVIEVVAFDPPELHVAPD